MIKKTFLTYYFKYLFKYQGDDLRFKVVETQKERKPAFDVRGRVYGQEEGFFVQSPNNNILCEDEFDRYSVLGLAYHGSLPIGSARLILDSGLGLQIENYFNIDPIEHRVRPFAGEISRFGVLKNYRGKIYRRLPSVGLLRLLYCESERLGLEYWYMSMGQKLHNSFREMDCFFRELRQYELTDKQKEKRALLGNYWKKVDAKPYYIPLKEISWIKKIV